MTPHSPDSEAAVIALCLASIDGAEVDRCVSDGVKPESFYDWRNGAIFGSLVRIRAKSLVPDLVAVCGELAACGELDRAGGPGHVSGLLSAAPATSSALSQHIEKILTTSAQRRAIAAARDTVAALEAEYHNREELHNAVSVPLAKVESQLHAQAKVRSWAAVVDEATAKVDGPVRVGDTITTGLHDFDKFATPIASQELVVIAARPSVGKSSLSRQIAWNAARQGKRVAVFLLECSDTSFVEGCAAQESRVPTAEARDALPEHRKRYTEALRKIRGMDNIKLYDHDLSLEAIESRCRVLKTAFRPDLVLCDYLQLVRGGSAKLSTADRIGQITSAFVALVKAMNCPILLMSQLSRTQERESNRQPVLSDLRDSGHIESDATRVIFIHRPTKDRQGMDQSSDAYRTTYACQLIQAKNRFGPRCCVDVDFRAPIATFENAAQ